MPQTKLEDAMHAAVATVFEMDALISWNLKHLANFRRMEMINGINLKGLPFSKSSFEDSDCVVVVTDHSNVDYTFIAKNSELIVDTRNVFKGYSVKGEHPKIIRL